MAVSAFFTRQADWTWGSRRLAIDSAPMGAAARCVFISPREYFVRNRNLILDIFLIFKAWDIVIGL
jgi:hypothetical protein